MNSLSSNMERQCHHHGKPFIVACIEQRCQQPFLCLVCYRTHNENHSEFIDLLENDTKWLKPHEIELEQLAKHPLLTSPTVQHDVLAHNKELINQMIENLVRKIKEKGNLWIEEMTKQMKEQRAIEKFTQCLREKYEIIQNVNFRQDDIFHLAKEVIRFREELLPDVQEALKLMNEDLTKWKLNPIKVLQVEKMLQKVVIENINLDNLFSELEADHLKTMSLSLRESLELKRKLQKESNDLKETEKKFKNEIKELEERLILKNENSSGTARRGATRGSGNSKCRIPENRPIKTQQKNRRSSEITMENFRTKLPELLNWDIDEQREVFGNLLFPTVLEIVGPRRAPKVTGMLIGPSVLEVTEILEFIENPKLLQESIDIIIELI